MFPRVASATKSAELYTGTPYGYGRFEARLRFAAGDGVVSAFFLWKDGSEKAGTFWNELDYEKIAADCELQTNALYGNPSASHTQRPTVTGDLCSQFHVYAYEWTADYIAWSIDGKEVRRETGDTAAAYAQNATALQIHFNLWPGDSSFGGNFSPSILPVYQYVDWVQYSSYANGAFTLAWREDFDGSTLPSGWLTGNWASSKNLSTHDPANVSFLNSCAVLSMTADDALGSTGADTTGCTPGMGSAGAAGTTGQGGMAGTAGASTGGVSAGGTAQAGGNGGTNASGATGGTNASGATGGASGGAGGMSATGGAGGAGAGSSVGGSGAVAAGAAAGASSAGTAGATGVGGGATGGTSSSLGGSPTGDNSGGSATESTAGQGSKDDNSSGCGCRVPSSTRSPQRGEFTGALLVLALAGAFRRRQASRTSRVR